MSEMYRYLNAGAVWAYSFGNLADVRARHVVTGAPTIVNSPLGGAMRFDGAADYVTLSAAWEVPLRFDAGTQDFSICAWVRRGVSGAAHTIIDKRDGGGDGWVLGVLADDRLRMSIQATTGYGPVLIQDSLWHCVVGVVDRSIGVTAYLDGVPGVVTAGAGVVMATTTPPRVGAVSYGAAQYFNGDIHSIAIFDRVLTPAEVADLASGSGPFDYEKSCAHRYDMSTPIGLPDLGVVGGNPGTGANIVSNPSGVGGGICAEFNGGNGNYNLGDVAMLNAVSQSTIALWMNQDVVDVANYIFVKEIDLSNLISVYTWGDGRLYIRLANGSASRGYLVGYNTVVSAGRWHHLAVVFDGSQINNASRLKLYVDAVPLALTFVGTIPATTVDLSGVDAVIGAAVTSFNGELDDFRIYSQPLTNIQVADLYARSRQGRTAG